jgi:DNA-directed RNA polymerase II subunit RPB1
VREVPVVSVPSVFSLRVLRCLPALSDPAELFINECLGSARSKASLAVKQVLPESANSVVAMVAAGSKGNDNNIAQILACVAQQNVDSQRIPDGFKDRTLPHFCKFDIGSQAKGFVENVRVGHARTRVAHSCSIPSLRSAE